MIMICVCPHVDTKREDLLKEFASHKDPLRRLMIMELCQVCLMESILAMKPENYVGEVLH